MRLYPDGRVTGELDGHQVTGSFTFASQDSGVLGKMMLRLMGESIAQFTLRFDTVTLTFSVTGGKEVTSARVTSTGKAAEPAEVTNCWKLVEHLAERFWRAAAERP